MPQSLQSVSHVRGSRVPICLTRASKMQPFVSTPFGLLREPCPLPASSCPSSCSHIVPWLREVNPMVHLGESGRCNASATVTPVWRQDAFVYFFLVIPLNMQFGHAGFKLW